MSPKGDEIGVLFGCSDSARQQSAAEKGICELATPHAVWFVASVKTLEMNSNAHLRFLRIFR